MASRLVAPLPGLAIGDDGRNRCAWGSGDAVYRAYHDSEWGLPVTNDRRLFEKICLEGFQSGLSWLTILRKRENFRKAFAAFDPAKVARFGARDVQRLLRDEGIVRHRGKIESTINNARMALVLREEFGSLARYFWSHEPAAKDRPRRVTLEVLRATTQSPASVSLSKDLKRRGFSFVGPTTAYAFMQAMGLVNDHISGCHARVACDAERSRLRRP
jgi:DNA-3-methyladenine glycosylase I